MPDIIEVGPENFSIYSEEILDIERASFISPWSLNSFKAEAIKHISYLWVLISDSIVSGYICFWIMEGEIQLLNLAVRPERRRRHLGQFLLTRMIEKGLSLGVKTIWLEVRQSNTGARHLYKKMGFIETGIRHGYYSETKEDAVLMTLELSVKGDLKPHNLTIY